MDEGCYRRKEFNDEFTIVLKFEYDWRMLLLLKQANDLHTGGVNGSHGVHLVFSVSVFRF